jgi:UDP-N-acetylmuramoyl-tripeptide--D-alanyl-D-alanine ligase
LNTTLEQICGIVRGRVVSLGGNPSIRGISTDSRTVEPGEVLVALVGDKFDAHGFLPQAYRRGAAGAVVIEERLSVPVLEALGPEFGLIGVGDTLAALGDLASEVRGSFSGPVVGITGSNGKTTTKEMVASILATRGSVLKSPGNFNNLVGLPLTLFQLKPGTDFLVLEMGANAFGEVRRLTHIAQPTVGLITNVGPAHLEGFGDLDGVAEAKGELIEELSESSTFVLNADDSRIATKAERFKGKKVVFGRKPGSTNLLPQVWLESDRILEPEERGELWRTRVTLHLPDGDVELVLNGVGDHLEQDALAASAVAVAVGVDAEAVQEGLEAFVPVGGRSRLFRGLHGVRILDEAYNANPASMRAALSTAVKLKGDGRVLAALGDMAELGAHSESLHREVGAELGKLGVDEGFLVGAFSEHVRRGAVEQGMEPRMVHRYESLDRLIGELTEVVREKDVVVVKGSRVMGMERVVESLRAGAANHAV